jgi:hypothetical protein
MILLTRSCACCDMCSCCRPSGHVSNRQHEASPQVQIFLLIYLNLSFHLLLFFFVQCACTSTLCRADEGTPASMTHSSSLLPAPLPALAWYNCCRWHQAPMSQCIDISHIAAQQPHCQSTCVLSRCLLCAQVALGPGSGGGANAAQVRNIAQCSKLLSNLQLHVACLNCYTLLAGGTGSWLWWWGKCSSNAQHRAVQPAADPSLSHTAALFFSPLHAGGIRSRLWWWSQRSSSAQHCAVQPAADQYIQLYCCPACFSYPPCRWH